MLVEGKLGGALVLDSHAQRHVVADEGGQVGHSSLHLGRVEDDGVVVVDRELVGEVLLDLVVSQDRVDRLVEHLVAHHVLQRSLGVEGKVSNGQGHFVALALLDLTGQVDALELAVEVAEDEAVLEHEGRGDGEGGVNRGGNSDVVLGQNGEDALNDLGPDLPLVLVHLVGNGCIGKVFEALVESELEGGNEGPLDGVDELVPEHEQSVRGVDAEVVVVAVQPKVDVLHSDNGDALVLELLGGEF
mmetsp:Transcript_16121/g.27255  ORF Transcript_16121/g.27255 Transcript_16121/m.27255 type:complete len:245 (-) Transcript_16121:407-1141(-)